MSIDYNKHFTTSLSRFLNSEFEVTVEGFEFQTTRKEFEGDITLLVFPLLRFIKTNPEKLATAIGTYLVDAHEAVVDFNVVKGFLNLSLTDAFYLNEFDIILKQEDYGHQSQAQDAPTLMVEFSSPNTNKPLHLGHIRNNVLGYSVSKILEANGNRVVKTQIINDRGIHICKSMVAWKKFGSGETPEHSGIKGDQLVGKYYVIFDREYKKEIVDLISKGVSEENAKQQAPLLLEAQELLRLWEANDKEVRKLWETMNHWVYRGFEDTYMKLGVSFDSYYYESDTYLLGKKIINKGLDQGVFYRKEDGSVWIDLTEEGLDEKLLLRADGTSVYMTQDLGTALSRLEDEPNLKGMVYTVGNEQDYHFKVLFLILKKLGFDWSDALYHLSYGMVDLPSGKMKSREGTVVDADDLIEDMTVQAKTISEAVGKLESLSEKERKELYHVIALGALKYFILKVDPKKSILFDPEASIDFNGNTGPFIQYTHARIKTLIRKAAMKIGEIDLNLKLETKERELIKQLGRYPEVVILAGEQYSPALIANYLYDLVKSYNTFYQNISVLGIEDVMQKNLRVALSQKVAEVISNASSLLGMEVPEYM
ncbi:arginine--tRNA ligase [Flavobacteriaceae bacterium]|jgi:arginyl-tRNA synthetase|nr:arginine--tRNA ligase [Flavobacteriaceae bacterium]MDA8644523.1 arginine--tRNA ligase [Flavobacteriaceae bacterium]MDC0386743.1 arginine--tRNA ligase [Flavobacteriaceae bacterium]MDC0871811.1 arginine--tRNA ligase [Flavobacteriaceae bacterium]